MIGINNLKQTEKHQQEQSLKKYQQPKKSYIKVGLAAQLRNEHSIWRERLISYKGYKSRARF